MQENKKEKVEQCANSQKREKTKRAQRLRHGGTTQKGKPIFSARIPAPGSTAARCRTPTICKKRRRQASAGNQVLKKVKIIASLCVFAFSKQQRYAPQAGYTHYGIDDPCCDRCRAAAYTRHKIVLKQPDQQPVKRADYNQRQRYFIHHHNSSTPLLRVKGRGNLLMHKLLCLKTRSLFKKAVIKIKRRRPNGKKSILCSTLF